jgi:hypothetical protein
VYYIWRANEKYFEKPKFQNIDVRHQTSEDIPVNWKEKVYSKDFLNVLENLFDLLWGIDDELSGAKIILK